MLLKWKIKNMYKETLDSKLHKKRNYNSYVAIELGCYEGEI